jgi:hypothetical protein
MASFTGRFFAEVNFRFGRWTDWVRWFAEAVGNKRQLTELPPRGLLNVVVGCALAMNSWLITCDKFAPALPSIVTSQDIERFNAILPLLGDSVNEPLPNGQFLLHILIDANLPNALYSLMRIATLNPNRSSR